MRTLTIDSLLEKHHIKGVDLLQVDTEGYDFEIVKLCLRAGMKPRIINYEYVHLAVTQQVECRRLLAQHGYRFLNVSKDTLATRDL